MSVKDDCRVIILWGDEEVNYFYDYADWTKDNVLKILEHIEVYDFDTEAEAEAFRMGLCAVKTPSAKDFTEITERSYQSLKDIAEPKNRKPSPRRAA